MISPQKLVDALKEEPEGIKELQAQKSEIDNKIGELIGTRFEKAFGQITITQLRKIWKKADHTQRYWILDSNGDVEMQVEKLDSHGGLRDTEIIQEIIEAEWNKCEWLEDMDSYFEPYCKEESKVLKFSKVWDNLSEKEKMEKLKACNAWGYQNHNANAKWNELSSKHVQTLLLVYEGIIND